MLSTSQSQCPRILRCGSTTFRFLGLRVRISPAAWMPISCEFCVYCQVNVPATGRSLVQRSPTECEVSECDRGTSWRRAGHTRAVEPWKKKMVSTCHAVRSCKRDGKLTITSHQTFITGYNFDPDMLFRPLTWWYSEENCNNALLLRRKGFPYLQLWLVTNHDNRTVLYYYIACQKPIKTCIL